MVGERGGKFLRGQDNISGRNRGIYTTQTLQTRGTTVGDLGYVCTKTYLSYFYMSAFFLWPIT